MDDLGQALAGSEKKYMLGGGNPALSPEVSRVWRKRMHEILADGDSFERAVGLYDTPQGRPRFIEALVELLNREYGWGITGKNIAVTNGSQSAFFMLFTLFAGEGINGARRRILFPLLPEYIGYADQALNVDDFVAYRPLIEIITDHTHKYHIDFNALRVTDDIGAICVSRPTNPSGNVLTDEEIVHLDRIAHEADVRIAFPLDLVQGSAGHDARVVRAAEAQRRHRGARNVLFLWK